MNLIFVRKVFFLSTIFFSIFSISFAADLNVTKYPESPKEGEEIKLTLTSDKYNLDLAEITWTLDGVELDSGTGRKILNFKTSSSGQTQVIVTKVTQEGYNDSQIQTVIEANTNFMLYEGVDSYVPNFYRGRRLPAREGTARVGFFNFKDGEIAGFSGNSNGNYYWSINGEDKADLSGQNKMVNNIISKVTDNTLSIKTIRVSSDGSSKTNNLTVPLQQTETVIYKTDENRLTRQPLSDTEIGKKIILLVEPFFFSVTNKRDANLIYTWKINDIATVISTPWAAMFSGKESDSVKINLDIANNKKITQESSEGFTFKVE